MRSARCMGIVLSFALSLSTSVFAQGDKTQPFRPVLNALCGSGAELSEGCDEIRARPHIDATVAPWRAIGRVNRATWQRTRHCTGTLVGPRHVLTAAHCLYDSRRQIWTTAERLTFAAGYQRGRAQATSKVKTYVTGSKSAPGSQASYSTSVSARSLDWAILTLEEDIGRSQGYLEINASSENRGEAPFPDIIIPGYAGLRPHILTKATGCTEIPLGAPQNLMALATCPTMRGDSGGPVLIVEDGAPIIIGLLSGVAATTASGMVSIAVVSPQFKSTLDRISPDR